MRSKGRLRKKPVRGILWSRGDISLLRRYYPKVETVEVAKTLGRTPQAVRQKAFALCLKKLI